MLDIAGGVVLGGGILGLFVGGLRLIGGADRFAAGLVMLLIAAALAFWLVFVRTGLA